MRDGTVEHFPVALPLIAVVVPGTPVVWPPVEGRGHAHIRLLLPAVLGLDAAAIQTYGNKSHYNYLTSNMDSGHGLDLVDLLRFFHCLLGLVRIVQKWQSSWAKCSLRPPWSPCKRSSYRRLSRSGRSRRPPRAPSPRFGRFC